MRRFIVAGVGCLIMPSQFGLLKPFVEPCKVCKGEDYMPNGDACPNCNLFGPKR